MKKFAPGLRGGSYSEADDLNMQIEIVNGQAFLDRWAGGGWKNISVHKSYEEALGVGSIWRDVLAHRTCRGLRGNC